MIQILQATPGQHAQLLGTLVFATLPLAWWFGRAPERSIAVAMSAILSLDPLFQSFYAAAPDPASFQPGYALRDGLLLLAMTATALRANRLYPIVMAGAALVAALTHWLRWLALFEGQFSYVVLTTAPSFVTIAAFWIGLVFHIRRERRVGAYPDWLSSRASQTIAAASKIG